MTRACGACGAALAEHPHGGRPRLYCSKACWRAVYNAQPRIRAYHREYDARPEQVARRAAWNANHRAVS